MTRNPYLNALFAAVYIVFIVLLITYGPTYVREKPDTILAPMAVLSLLVCSVAFMGYAFFFQPVVMYMEGQKREAVELFTKTLISFAVLTAIVVGIAFTV
jgi:multisubunit Na+/H+ antiporter MnhC subunit